jgi:transcriptional regulator with XRE-family HTH domain
MEPQSLRELSEDLGLPALPTTLHERIRWLRRARDLRGRDVAATIGVAYGTYKTWEQGVHAPPATVIPALARALSVDPNTLYGDEWTEER